MKNERRTLYGIAAVAALLAAAVYLPSLRNGFVWDDFVYVYDNPVIRSLDGALFRRIFTYMPTGNWHPLTWLSHAADHAFWGLDPAGHRLTNILLHGINTFLVVLLAAKLFKAAGAGDRSRGRGAEAGPAGPALTAGAAVTGLLFGLHPLHAESVAWIAERKDLLCAFFLLLGIFSYLRYAEAPQEEHGRTGRPGSYLLLCAFFALALASKAMAVTLPLVLLLLDWYPLGRYTSLRRTWPLFREKLPLFAMSAVVSVVTLEAQRSLGFVAAAGSIPLPTRILVAGRSLVMYLRNMAYPEGLVPLYPHPGRLAGLPVDHVVPAALALAITAGCIMAVRRSRVWAAVWGFFVIMLLPVLGLVQVGQQAMADRYTYLPSFGPFLLLGLGVSRIWGRGARIRSAALLAAAGILALLAWRTTAQIAIWKDPVTLWSAVIEKEGGHAPVAYYNRAISLREAGEPDRALQDYDRYLLLKPDDPNGYLNRGLVRKDQGEIEQAIGDFTKAAALSPALAGAYANRGLALRELGRPDPAYADLSAAIALQPENAELYLLRGMLQKDLGKFDGAIEDYTRAVRLQPSFREAYNNRGAAYKNLGRLDLAVADYSRAIAIDPSFGLAYCNRAIALGMEGRYDEAISDYTKAISLQPDLVKAYLDRGGLYLRRGETAPALADLRAACGLGSEEGCGALRLRGDRLPGHR